MNLVDLLVTWGYPLVFLGAVAEGEVVLLLAGYVAHRQQMSLPAVAACAALGGMTGDFAYFILGRRYGDRVLLRLPEGLRARAEQARDMVRRNPVRVLLAMRFLYGMRIILPILCGASGISRARFARYNAATAVAWSTLFTGLGYAFGAAAAAVVTRVERYEGLVLLALVAAGLGLHFMSRRLQSWVASDGPKDGREP